MALSSRSHKAWSDCLPLDQVYRPPWAPKSTPLVENIKSLSTLSISHFTWDPHVFSDWSIIWLRSPITLHEYWTLFTLWLKSSQKAFWTFAQVGACTQKHLQSDSRVFPRKTTWIKNLDVAHTSTNTPLRNHKHKPPESPTGSTEILHPPSPTKSQTYFSFFP